MIFVKRIKLNELKKLYVNQQSDLLTLQKSLSTLEENRESFQNNILVWVPEGF